MEILGVDGVRTAQVAQMKVAGPKDVGQKIALVAQGRPTVLQKVWHRKKCPNLGLSLMW